MGMKHEMIETFNLMFNSCNPLNWAFLSRKKYLLFNNSCEKTCYKWKNIENMPGRVYIFLESPSFKEHFYVFFSLFLPKNVKNNFG